MKIPLTDKFLWDVYKAMEWIGKKHDYFAPRTMREAAYPELWKMKKEYQRRRSRKEFSQLIYYLKKKGYIKIKSLEGTEGVILTEKGLERVWKARLRLAERKRRKDGKWQMLIFDIPEEKRKLRDILREHLVLLDYQMFQQSVWVCPYDVLKETEEMVRMYSLDPYVKLFMIKEIEV
ncbi:MAG: hypothetical protein HYT49_02500 [Candidatus Wildermuthbacteria bacterium]|nr:hypothetical protein [Candidatus Wildermuthbacteria bacterium]